MIWWKMKSKDRLIVKYMIYMGIVILMLFDFGFLLISCSEKVIVGSDTPQSDTTMVVQHMASPSNPLLSSSTVEEHPSFGGMGEAISLVEDS